MTDSIQTCKESTISNIATFHTTIIPYAVNIDVAPTCVPLLHGCVKRITNVGECSPFLCILSAIASIQPSLHLLDLF